jgi:hypothetical protein
LANQFSNFVKQKLLPDFTGSATQVPSATGIVPVFQVKDGISAPTAERLSLGESQVTGGTGRIADINPGYWYSMLQPMRPMAPADFRPRQTGFAPGQNLIWTPGDEKNGITFENLRFLADNWDILRLMIETRKDQMTSCQWEIRAKSRDGETKEEHRRRSAADQNIKDLTDFFAKPDGFHDWRTWMRMWLEDLFVCDAVGIYLQRDKKGCIASCQVIDGATICRNLDDMGQTPIAPSVAYQQVLYGTPQCDLTTDDLIYFMRNERSNRRYGYGPVEQILATIGIGLRKQVFLTEYYTSGNIPEALCFLPPQLPPERIGEIQDWFDSMMAGDLQKRRRLTFLPGFSTSASASGQASPNIVFPKETLLKDELDEWLMKIAAFAMSVSPQNLMKMINRSSAQQSSENALSEGQEALTATVEDIHNKILNAMGYSDEYEWAVKERRSVNPKEQAEIDNMLAGKVYTINELREQRGDDLRPEPEANMLGVFTNQGFVPLAAFQAQQQLLIGAQAQQIGKQPPASPLSPGAPDATTKAATTHMVKVDGHFGIVHPSYGDLNKYDQFIVFDRTANTYYYKGVGVEVVEAEAKRLGR